MGLFRKKGVPDELPPLALGRAQEPVSVAGSNNSAGAREKTVQKPTPLPSLKKDKPQDDFSETETGYFKDLIKSVTSEPESLQKLDSWYRNKFLKEDVVFQMREYWEKQQPELLLQNVSGELKQRLLEKTEKLHQLEREWQEVYFHLMEKEESIRKEEKELKDSLSEFINLHKDSVRKRKRQN